MTTQNSDLTISHAGEFAKPSPSSVAVSGAATNLQDKRLDINDPNLTRAVSGYLTNNDATSRFTINTWFSLYGLGKSLSELQRDNYSDFYIQGLFAGEFAQPSPDSPADVHPIDAQGAATNSHDFKIGDDVIDSYGLTGTVDSICGVCGDEIYVKYPNKPIAYRFYHPSELRLVKQDSQTGELAQPSPDSPAAIHSDLQKIETYRSLIRGGKTFSIKNQVKVSQAGELAQPSPDSPADVHPIDVQGAATKQAQPSFESRLPSYIRRNIIDYLQSQAVVYPMDFQGAITNLEQFGSTIFVNRCDSCPFVRTRKDYCLANDFLGKEGQRLWVNSYFIDGLQHPECPLLVQDIFISGRSSDKAMGLV